MTAEPTIADPSTCQSIDWYAEGDKRVLEIAGIQVTVRLVGRKGRKARIAIVAPAGAVFAGGASSMSLGDS